MVSIRVLSILALIAFPFSNSFAVDFKAPEEVTILNGEQLLNQVVGNTLGTVYWSQYHAPATDNPQQGEIRGYGQSAKEYVGTWSIDGHVMCFEYHHQHTASFNGCYTTSIKDNIITWYVLDGRKWYDPGGQIKLVPGNPKNY